MRPLVQKFLQQEFGKEDVEHLVTPMIIVLHSHRYNKGEDFAEGIDFTIIRSLIQSYSQEAREEFMQDKAMALFFNHFCLKGKNSFLSKSQGKTRNYVLEMEKELSTLQTEAVSTLNRV